MKIDELTQRQNKNHLNESDDPSKRVVWTYGRMNPPTRGHRMLVDKVAELAKGGDYWVFLSHSQDAKKNPLDWTTKVSFVKQIMKPHAAHVITQPDIKTPLQAANWLYDQGYTHITLVVGSDRVADMHKLLSGWNSEQIRQKDGRQEIQVHVVSAGERDPDAEGLAGISGTKAREAVQQDDMAAFQAATGVQGELALELFNAVKQAQTPVSKVKLKEDDHPGHIVKLILCEPSARQLSDWCKDHGIRTFSAGHMHLSIIQCEYPVEYVEHLDQTPTHILARPVKWKLLGTSLTLVVDAPGAVQLHDKLKDLGCHHKFPDFIPHVSVNYGYTPFDRLPTQVPDFTLEFDLIKAESLDPNFAAKVMM